MQVATTQELRRGLELVRRLLHGPPPSPSESARLLGNSSAAHKSVPLAIYSAAIGDFDGCVSYAVRCGGDADTIGAMAGAIAGARFGVSEIPARWLTALERGPRGGEHVERLATALVDAGGAIAGDPSLGALEAAHGRGSTAIPPLRGSSSRHL